MNTGAVSSRYARALLIATRDSGRGEQVCAQIRAMLADRGSVPSPLEPDLEHLVALLDRNHRLDCLPLVFHSFVDQYFRQEGIVRAALVTAVPMPELEQKVRGLLSEGGVRRVELESSVDPNIIGGFVLEVDDRQLDASVRRQIETLRDRFVEKVNRIV